MAIEKEYTLKLSTEQAQANIDELNKSLKLQEDLIEDIEKEIRDYEKQINKTSARDLAQRKSLNDKIQKTKERLKDEKVALKSVNKDRKEANATMKDSTANAKDYSGVLGIIDQKTGGAISGFTNLTGSVGGATKGFNLLKIAIIGTGIGALLIAITAVTAAFTSSEKGQNKFAKILAVVGSVVDNLVTLLSDLGEKIISVFENPKQAIKDFSNLIKENIVNRFEGLMELIPALGKAVSLLFKGEFSEAGKVAANAVGKVALGVEDVVGKTQAAISATKDFVDEIVKEGKIAGQIADQRAKADKLDRDLIIERANANRDRADLLNKAADRENKNVQEKIGFLKEAGQIEEDITNKEIAAAQLRLQAKIAENAQANSTKEDLLEEANLKARLIDLETAKLRKAKMVTTQIATLTAEARATEAAAQEIIDKKKEEDRLKAASDEEKRILAIKAITDKYKLEAELTELEQLLVDEEKRLKELELLDATEAEKAAIRAFYADKTEKAKEKNAEQEGKLAKMKLNQGMNDAKASFDMIGKLAGEDSKVGKAMAIASATISGIQGVMNAFQTANLSPITTVFPAYPYIQAGLAGAMALKNISAIKSVDSTGKGNTGSIPAPSSGGGGAPPLPPSFNVVGQSDTNQLADAIGMQEQQPIQAFVVSNEVSTAQELDRNIVDGASIG